MARASINLLCFQERIQNEVLIDFFNLFIITIALLIILCISPQLFLMSISFILRDCYKLIAIQRAKPSKGHIFLLPLIIALFYFYSIEFYFILFIAPLIIIQVFFKIKLKLNLDITDLLSYKCMRQKIVLIVSDTATYLNNFLI